MIWDRLIHKIINPRVLGAEFLGLERQELFAIGRLAAVRAERSYDSEAGRCLSSWVWLCVYYDVDHAIRDVVRQLRTDTEFCAIAEEGYEGDPAAADAVEYLSEQLSEAEWSLLWMRAVEGWEVADLAAAEKTSEMVIYQRFSRARKKAVKLLLAAGK